jgi:hypothetical protein
MQRSTQQQSLTCYSLILISLEVLARHAPLLQLPREASAQAALMRSVEHGGDPLLLLTTHAAIDQRDEQPREGVEGLVVAAVHRGAGEQH